MTPLDPETCYRAMRARDRRFDGRFFTGVKTTGVYCRPVCPARPPKPENCEYHPTAAACEAAGFRSCLRCRPEASPEHAVWRGTSAIVDRGLRLIADGALDGDYASAAALADRLGVGERHLRRLFLTHLGASPQAVAQTRRVAFAKRLIESSRLSMTEVALASGFGSVRRFNDAFAKLYGRPPMALRRERAGAAAAASDAAVELLLSYRPPYDWTAVLDFLGTRAVDGLETVDGGVYRRTFVHAGAAGSIEVRHAPDRCALGVAVRTPDPRGLAVAAARVRRVFDLDADVTTIEEHLAADPWLQPLAAARPGLRVPGGWDGFELAIRAVLGQQVTLSAARALACRLVARYGEALDPAKTGHPALTRAFPTAEALATADLGDLGMPGARRRTLSAVARATLADPRLFEARGGLDETLARLRAIPGVGDWTAQYVALRACREPDAFPASDVGLLRAVAGGSERPTPQALLERAEAWRPWRAYAAQHLWTADPGLPGRPEAGSARGARGAPHPTRPGAGSDRVCGPPQSGDGLERSS